MKRDIYKEVPESFHEQLERTLSCLEDTPAKAGRLHKRYGLLLAAAVLACASVTAAAAGIMGWHERLSDYFGTEKELEDKLSMQHVAIPQDAVTEGEGLKFQALQAVRTDTYFYFLVEVTVPDGIEWNGDILFEECEAVGTDYRCVPGFVSDSFADDRVLLELQVLYDEPAAGQPAAENEELRIRLKNLIQTRQLEKTACLAEGEWELLLRLPPAEADTVRFYPEGAITFGGHELYFTKVDISPFRIRLYADKETALHAAWGQPVALAGIRYEDETVVEESGLCFNIAGHTDAAGEFCFEMSLQNAVDPGRVAGILLSDAKQQEFSFDERKQTADSPDVQTESRQREQETGEAEKRPENDVPLSEVRLLYVKYDHVVFEAGQSVWWWDERCGSCQELFSLEEYGFSREQGGEITMGQGRQIQILPRKDSDEMYLYTIADGSMLTLDAETFWPWPTYETYMESFREITELVPAADDRYSRQAFYAQEGWYYLYSEEQTAADMELRMHAAVNP